MSKFRLYVDMDGTLATFTPVEQIDTLYEEGYFKNLEPMENMVNAIKNIVNKKDLDVYVLSSVLQDSTYAKKEKNDWLDKHLSIIDTEHRIFCDYGKEKSLFISNPRDTDVLIDDYTKNLNDWHGIGIKLLNGLNDTNKSWTGDRINSFLEPNILSYTIKNTILNAITSKRGIEGEKKVAKENKSLLMNKSLQKGSEHHER